MEHYQKWSMVLVTGIMLSSGCSSSTEGIKPVQYPVHKAGLSWTEMETSYSATVRGRQDIDIYPQISGRITEVLIQEGQTVKKGQVMFIIDQIPYIAALRSAEADCKAAKAALQSARLDYESTMNLYENKVVSAYELQTSANNLNSAEATLAQAEASLTEAENNLSYTEVTSPADGITGTIPYREGALVSSSIQTPLTTVSDNSLMYVYFSLNENTVLDLIQEYGDMGTAIDSMPDIRLKLSNGTEYNQKGRIASISGVINRTTGTVSVRAEFPNPDRILISGANGSIVLPVQYDKVIIIPQESTYELQDKIMVYKVVDGRTKSTQIKVAPHNDGKNYIVTDGLEPGDLIIAKGAGLLRDGIEIDIAQQD